MTVLNNRTLHIFSSSQKCERIINEHYPFNNSKLQNDNYKLNFTKKNPTENDEKQCSSKRKKIPRSIREHTDFDKRSHKMTCPNCLSYIETDIYYYTTDVTHTMAASLVPICMCILPYCIAKYKDVAHYCPRCEIYLGTKFGSRRNICNYYNEPSTQK